jgi:dimethylaniline monooxygenase (N-oxide forming)
METNKTLAVIGGGVSGIISAKWAKQDGYKVTIFEKESALGGNWRLGDSNIWPDMETNTNKYLMYLYDYKLPDTDSFYITKEQFNRHLNNYVSDFGLGDLFKYSSTVKHVKRLGDKVHITFLKNGKEFLEIFDYILICTGMFSVPDYHNYKNNISKVSIIHARDYKYPYDFKGKNVMVIGNAHSGTEIASEICLSANKVYHVFKKPYWVLKKLSYNQEVRKLLPNDSRVTLANEILKKKIESNSEKNKITNMKMNMVSKQGKISKHLEVDKDSEDYPYYSISEKYLDYIQKGLINVYRSKVKSVGESSVIIETFEAEELELPVDTIILCFGYKSDLSFLDQEILDTIEYDHSDKLVPTITYKTIYHPKLPNFGFIGICRGLLLSINEFMARCVLRHFKNPFPKETDYDLEPLRAIRMMRNKPQVTNYFYDYYLMFADDLGSMPDFEKIQKEDPELYSMLMNGPFLPMTFWIGEGDDEISRKWIEEIKMINKSISKPNIIKF